MNFFPRRLILSAILFISTNAGYAQDDIPRIGKSTVLTYKIRENGASFNYVATVNSFSDRDGLSVTWKTTEVPERSGKFDLPFSSLEKATQLYQKIIPGMESFGPDESRLFVSRAMTEDISNVHLSNFKVDGKENAFLFVSTVPESKEIDCNHVMVKVDYNSGEDNNVHIGIANLANVSIIGSFFFKSYSLELISITTAMITTTENKNNAGLTWGIKMLYPTLALIEDYDPTAGGTINKPFKETYDYRMEAGNSIPPSHIDAFIVDLKNIYSHKAQYPRYITGDFKVTGNLLPKEEIIKIINVYLNTDASDLTGYRPWTHQQFLKSLTAIQRENLAKNAEEYIHKIGFHEY